MAWVAGKRTNAGLFAALAVGALLQPVACDGPGDSTTIDADLSVALAPVGPRIEAELAQFGEDLAVLDAAVAGWATALQTSDGTAEQAIAQDAYLVAMGTWQRLEVLQIGPAASSLTAVGGEDLRDEVYTWPDAVSGCRVDTETVEEAWDDTDFFTANLVNSYGLDAVEHLLFAPLTTECPSQVGIDSQWATLGDAGVRANRVAYAAVLVDHLEAQSDELHGRWEGELSAALAAGELPWANPSEALNAVFDGLFYVETRTKDRKLAEPMGLRECTLDCELLIEAPLSDDSIARVRENLVSAQAVFRGGDSDGFDALLEELGHGDIATDLDAAFVQAIATADTLADRALDTLIVDDPTTAQTLHDDVKAVGDLLKGDFATVLLLEIPAEAAGDND